MIVEANMESILYVAQNMIFPWTEEYTALVDEFSPESLAWERWSTPGIKYMCLDETGLPVMVGGLLLHQPGVAHAWMFGTDGWKRHLKEIIKHTKRAVHTMLDKGICHRVQVISGAERETAQRWIELLGLRFEHTLRGYGKDEQDFHMYSLLKEDVRV